MEQVRLRGADRASEDARNLVVRQLMINPKNQRRTLLRWKLFDRRADFLRALAAEERCLRRFGADIDAVARLERFAARGLERQAIEARVDRDPVEPGGQARFALESFQAFEGADKRILRQIRGVLVIGDIAIAELIDLTAVALDDDVESIALTSQAEADERGVVGLRPRGIDDRSETASSAPVTRTFQSGATRPVQARVSMASHAGSRTHGAK